MLRAATAVVATLATLAAAPHVAAADCVEPVAASYAEPTGRYPHGVLGDRLEWGALEIACAGGARIVVTLPEELVFEDVAPRMAALDARGRTGIVVVESHEDRGARLAIWGIGPAGVQRLATTPFIGTRFRWLAPLGAADLDGDGTVELAYVDRPHLAKVLRVWRFSGDRLEPVASLDGVTNHRIGESDIAGGIRDCAGRPEMIAASDDWRRLLAVRLEGDALAARDIGPHEGRASFAAAMECR